MTQETLSQFGGIILLRGSVVSFGPFTFDSVNGALTRGDIQIHLPPRALAVLAQLIRRPNTLVTRSELLDEVWEDVHVTEDALTQAVSLIRQALCDDPRNPAYIETVPCLGYRFIDSVTVAKVAGAGADSAGCAGPEWSHYWSWLIPAGAGLLLLASLTILDALIPLWGFGVGAKPGIALVGEGAPFRGRSLAFWSALSPEGTRIAYVSITTGELMLRDLRDGTDRQLTRGSHSAPFRYSSPMTTAWSPDGRQIAYTWKNGNHRRSTWQVRTVSSDGGDPAIKLEGFGERFVLYDWSPDGGSLLLARTSEQVGTGGGALLRSQPNLSQPEDYAASLVELSVTTGEIRTIQGLDQGVPNGASYSPDGKRIAYDALAERNRGVFVVARDGKQKVRVSDPSVDAHVPEWSPDGRYLLFVVRDGASISVYAVPTAGLHVWGDLVAVKKGPYSSTRIENW